MSTKSTLYLIFVTNQDNLNICSRKTHIHLERRSFSTMHGWAEILRNWIITQIFINENFNNKMYCILLSNIINPLLSINKKSTRTTCSFSNWWRTTLFLTRCVGPFALSIFAHFPNHWMGRRKPRDWCGYLDLLLMHFSRDLSTVI